MHAIERAASHAPASATIGTEAARATTTAAVVASQASEGASLLSSRVRSLVERPAQELTADDWNAFAAALAADPLGTTLVGPRTVGGGPDLRLVVDSLRLGARDELPNAERYFAAWRAAALDPDVQRTRLIELMRTPPQDMAPDDWRAIRAFTDADPDGVRTGIPGVEGDTGMSSLRPWIRWNVARDEYGGDPLEFTGLRMSWLRANDPEYPQRLAEVVDLVGTRALTPDERRLLSVEAEHGLDGFGALLPGRAPEHMREVVFVASGNNHSEVARWMRDHDPDYASRLAAVVDRVAGGDEQLKLFELELLRTGSDRLEELVAGRPLVEQRRIAEYVLRFDGGGLSAWRHAHDPEWPGALRSMIDEVTAGTGTAATKETLRREDAFVARELDLRPFEQVAAFRERLMYPEKYAAWMRQHDPAWDARVRGAAASVLNGTGTPAQEAILRLERTRFADLAAGRPYAEQDRLAAAMMGPFLHSEWQLANDPEQRALAFAAVQRLVDGGALLDGDSTALSGAGPMIDELVAGQPFEVQERIARAVFETQPGAFAMWMHRMAPDRNARIDAAVTAVVAGTHSREQASYLNMMADDLPVVLANLPILERMRIFRTIGSMTNEPRWMASIADELAAARRSAVDSAAIGELSDDARKLLHTGGDTLLDALPDSMPYEVRLRIADAVHPGATELAQWTKRNDPHRVEHIRAAVDEVLAGTASPHALRVLRGNGDAMALVSDLPYEQQHAVASHVLGESALQAWTRSNDPAYQAKLVVAVRHVASGAASPEVLDLLDSDRAALLRALAQVDRPTQQAAFAGLLGRTVAGEIDALSTAKRFAVEAQQRLASIEPEGLLVDLHAKTRDMLELNIRRMTRTLEDDPNRGYSNQPDYAELGRVGANLDFMEAVAKQQEQARSAPELLTW